MNPIVNQALDDLKRSLDVLDSYIPTKDEAEKMSSELNDAYEKLGNIIDV